MSFPDRYTWRLTERQTHDYGEMIEMDLQTAEETLAGAKVFVVQVKTYLQSIDHWALFEKDEMDS